MGIKSWVKGLIESQGIGASPEHYYKTQYRNEMQRQMKWFEKHNDRKPTVSELCNVMQGSYSFGTIANLAHLEDKDIKNMARHLLEG